MSLIEPDDPPPVVLGVAITVVVVGFLLLWFGPTIGAQGERYRIALGKMEESSTCNFSMKFTATAIVTHPSAESCRRLRTLVGRSIRLIVEPEPEP